MRYIDFRDAILRTLHRNPDGLTWCQLKERLELPYRSPCPEWVKRMEREDGLVRSPGSGRAYVWRIESGDDAGALEFHPLTPDRWDDFVRLFGPKGAYAGCWCMWWRVTRREFEAHQGEGNRRAMKAIVEAGRVPGILGYRDGVPVAWCSVAPRSEFGSLNRSRVLKAIDDEPVWSIVCFFVARGHRRGGILGELIAAAVGHARSRGAAILEAYPSVPRSGRVPPSSSYMGFPDAFEGAGFVECARPSAAKRILRYRID